MDRLENHDVHFMLLYYTVRPLWTTPKPLSPSPSQDTSRGSTDNYAPRQYSFDSSRPVLDHRLGCMVKGASNVLSSLSGPTEGHRSELMSLPLPCPHHREGKGAKVAKPRASAAQPCAQRNRNKAPLPSIDCAPSLPLAAALRPVPLPHCAL